MAAPEAAEIVMGENCDLLATLARQARSGFQMPRPGPIAKAHTLAGGEKRSVPVIALTFLHFTVLGFSPIPFWATA